MQPSRRDEYAFTVKLDGKPPVIKPLQDSIRMSVLAIVDHLVRLIRRPYQPQSSGGRAMHHGLRGRDVAQHVVVDVCKGIIGR